MSADGINHNIPTELREIVAADDSIGRAGPDVIDSGFKLEQKIQTCTFLQGPFRMRDVSADSKALFFTAPEHLFQQGELSIGIERSIAKKYIFPVEHLKLPILL